MHRITVHDVYTWSYLVSCRFSNDWVGSSNWGSPIVPTAPPRNNDAMLSLNIDTYVDYVDK